MPSRCAEQLLEHTVTASDGAEVPVSRLPARGGIPVVLVPGMCDNRRIYWTTHGTGLANHLRSRG